MQIAFICILTCVETFAEALDKEHYGNTSSVNMDLKNTNYLSPSKGIMQLSSPSSPSVLAIRTSQRKRPPQVDILPEHMQYIVTELAALKDGQRTMQDQINCMIDLLKSIIEQKPDEITINDSFVEPNWPIRSANAVRYLNRMLRSKNYADQLVATYACTFSL